ncbi:MAG: hypothetical protein K2W95_30325 [Candidatus Obscuribacterales bacterium]|nr:hypothetical protein [Candidatus Obscuribacterales bacterium]
MSNSKEHKVIVAANCVFAFTQFCVPFLPSLGIGREVGESTAPIPAEAPELPIPYAFSIWFVIFSLGLVFSVYQALPRNRNKSEVKALRLPSTIGFALSTLWMLISQSVGNNTALVAIILAMMVFSLMGFRKVEKFTRPLSLFSHSISMPYFAILSGWLTFAIWLNFTSLARQVDPSLLGLSNTVFAFITLVPGSLLGGAILVYSRFNRWYAGTLVWALVSIVMNNVVAAHDIVVAVTAGLLTVAVIVSCLIAGRR